MLELSFNQLKKITNGIGKYKDKIFKVTGISTDTRSLKKGNLFFALTGANHDGHDFLFQAYKKGACCLILSNTEKKIPNIPYLKVDSVLRALEKTAKNVRKSIDAKFIAITGSVGKTGTKEMIKLALSNIGKTFGNIGSFNNHIGVPLSLSNIPNNSEYCVLEIGMNKMGEIKKLSNLVAPEIGIITAIENSHLNDLKTLKNIFKAKSELIDNVNQNGCFIYNADTNFSHELRKKAESKNIKNIISYGRGINTDIRFLGKIKDKRKYFIKAKYFKKTISWKMPDLSDHWYVNSLCILGLGKYFGVELDKLLEKLEHYRLPSGRGNLIKVEQWLKQFFILDESYNSNPASLITALEKFKEMKFEGNKIALLGDMNELGEHSQSLHVNMKQYIERVDISTIITFGKYMKRLNKVLSDRFKKYHFEELPELEKGLKKIVCTNDCLLVKGSHSLGLYSLVNKIRGIHS